MIYVVARHEGQYREFCNKAGLITGTDVRRLKHEHEIYGLQAPIRVILLHDWYVGVTPTHELFFEALRDKGAHLTSADW